MFCPEAIRPFTLKEFEKKFHLAENEISRSKMRVNSKINKKMSYEKDFNRILSCIQSEEHNLSKYLVVILGGENEVHSRTSGDI